MKKILVSLFCLSVITACSSNYSIPATTATPPQAKAVPDTPTVQPKASATPTLTSTSTPQPICHSHATRSIVYLDKTPAFAIRQGPGCEYEVVQSVHVQEDPLVMFDVLDKRGNWILVDLCNNQQGWAFVPAINDTDIHLNPTDFPMSSITQEAYPSTSTPINDKASMMQAQNTLISFYDLLYSKKYEEASKIFIGGYGGIIMWNPKINVQDYPTLLQTACEFNDYKCTLRVARITNKEQISPMEFHFTVEYKREDGSLYQRPYSEGDRKESTMISQFQVKVVKDCDGKYFVATWPFYRY